MAPRRRNKTTPKPSMLSNQRSKLKAIKLEAGPATTRGPSYGPGAGRTGMAQGNPLNFIRSAFALLGGPATTAAEVMRPTALADGTVRGAMLRGDYKPSQNMRGADEGLTRAQSFDKAFAKARAQGLAEFNWRGKRYNTRLAGE
jgi:hypothetical protein